MKIRIGFVANSSTTSFCFYGVKMNADELSRHLEKIGIIKKNRKEDPKYYDEIEWLHDILNNLKIGYRTYQGEIDKEEKEETKVIETEDINNETIEDEDEYNNYFFFIGKEIFDADNYQVVEVHAISEKEISEIKEKIKNILKIDKEWKIYGGCYPS